MMSRETIIRHIVNRDLANNDLSEESICKTELALYEIACEEFGSWETALEYAGVDARVSSKTDPHWTRDRVQQRLRRLCTTGYDLTAHVNRERNGPMYRAAIHYYGSWREALSASGINLAHTSRRCPKNLDMETMKLWLKEREASDQSLVWTKVCLENRTYALAIRRRFRSWKKALKAAGITDPY